MEELGTSPTIKKSIDLCGRVELPHVLQVQVANGSGDNPDQQPLGPFPAQQLHKQTDGALAFKREARNLGK